MPFFYPPQNFFFCQFRAKTSFAYVKCKDPIRPPQQVFNAWYSQGFEVSRSSSAFFFVNSIFVSLFLDQWIVNSIFVSLFSYQWSALSHTSIFEKAFSAPPCPTLSQPTRQVPWICTCPAPWLEAWKYVDDPRAWYSYPVFIIWLVSSKWVRLACLLIQVFVYDTISL